MNAIVAAMPFIAAVVLPGGIILALAVWWYRRRQTEA
jgi:hypothetical protein